MRPPSVPDDHVTATRGLRFLGFLYQVEVTVVRLLDLGENDLLELERGRTLTSSREYSIPTFSGLKDCGSWNRLRREVGT